MNDVPKKSISRVRQEWVVPTVTKIRAGSAEDIGQYGNDGSIGCRLNLEDSCGS